MFNVKTILIKKNLGINLKVWGWGLELKKFNSDINSNSDINIDIKKVNLDNISK